MATKRSDESSRPTLICGVCDKNAVIVTEDGLLFCECCDDYVDDGSGEGTAADDSQIDDLLASGALKKPE